MNFHLGQHKKLNPKFLVKAVAAFEPKPLIQGEDRGRESNSLSTIAELMSSTVHIESSDADLEEMDAKEKLRRLRISKANRGNTPWNKGRKHNPETIERIRERTKLAMQNPKVRMKLVNIGHAQSQETREKIGVGVRLGWQKRRQRLMLQETCLFDWQNLIAEAARQGFHDEGELQWDSYEILNEQLKKEWLDSIEHRKTMPKPKTSGSKKAPKSLEQRRKIAEAIAAKWADPEYRARVCSGLARYHGTPDGAERKAKKKPSGDGQATRKTLKKKVSGAEGSVANESKQQLKLKKPYVPKFKDPLASSKLEMLKSIRAQRVVISQAKMNETLERAKILIAEAEKAAKALEVAAMRSPVAQASLVETRKLIAEATRTIETIETGELSSHNDDECGHCQNHNGDAFTKDPSEEHPNGVNGFGSLQSSLDQNPDFNFYNLANAHFSSYKSDLVLTSRETVSGTTKKEFEHSDAIGGLDLRVLMDQCGCDPEPNGVARLNGSSAPNGACKVHVHEAPAARTAAKRWVRGKLVEVIEGE